MIEKRTTRNTAPPEIEILSMLPELGGTVSMQQVEALAKQVESEANGITITNDEDKIKATGRLAATRKAKSAIEVERKSRVDPLNKQVAGINQAFGFFALPIRRADEMIEGKIIAYDRELVRQRAEKIRIEAEALRERQRLAALADRAREIQEEAARKAKAAEEKIETAMTLEEFMAAEEEAERTKLSSVPSLEAAERVLEAQQNLPEPERVVVPEEPAKTLTLESGASSTTRQNWQWKITDETKIPRKYLTVDSAKITRLVKAGEREIEGILIFDQGGLSLRGVA